jgi:hypothetical protein
MLYIKYSIILLFACFTFFACGHGEQMVKYDQYFWGVLDESLDALRTRQYHVIDRLYLLKEKSENSNQLLVELLDYYIGEGGGEILEELITKNGKKMLPLLSNKKLQPLHCLPKYESICVKSIGARNKDIDLMIDAIQKGIVLRAEEPSPK